MRYRSIKNRLDKLEQEAKTRGIESKIGIVQVANEGNLIVFNSEHKFTNLKQIEKHIDKERYTNLIIDALGYYDYDSLLEQFHRAMKTKEEYEKHRKIVEKFIEQGNNLEPIDTYEED